MGLSTPHVSQSYVYGNDAVASVERGLGGGVYRQHRNASIVGPAQLKATAASPRQRVTIRWRPSGGRGGGLDAGLAGLDSSAHLGKDCVRPRTGLPPHVPPFVLLVWLQIEWDEEWRGRRHNGRDRASLRHSPCSRRHDGTRAAGEGEVGSVDMMPWQLAGVGSGGGYGMRHG
jgi:hypothetical protein